MTEYYIHYSDFVHVWIGPFASEEAAQEHITSVMVPRGDTSPAEVVDRDRFENDQTVDSDMVFTVEEDSEFVAWE